MNTAASQKRVETITETKAKAPRPALVLITEPRADNPQTGAAKPEVSEEFLHEMVESCASNVAVLNERGVLLYASTGWTLFEQASLFKREKNKAPLYFRAFRRCDDPAAPGGASSLTLSDDLNRLLAGKVKELQGQYSYRGLTDLHLSTVRAARLALPGSGFRILIAHEDIAAPNDALRKSEQRLSHLFDTTSIVAWEAEPDTWRFTYVSDQARKMLGYPVAAWYERGFLTAKIHASDRLAAWEACIEQSQVVD